MDLVKPVLAMLSVCVAAPAPAQELSRWQAEVAEASARFGVPEAWIWRVMRAESAGRAEHGGRPLRSRKGAMGLMQLMPNTWAEMRRLHDLGDDPDQPRDNILAGTAYLRAMYDRFGYPGLFAAYNAGPARYQAWLDRRQPLPGETIDYVARVVGTQPGRTSRARGQVAESAEPDVTSPPRAPAWRSLFLPLTGRPTPDSEQ